MTYNDWEAYWYPVIAKLICFNETPNRWNESNTLLSGVMGIAPLLNNADAPLTDDQKRVLKALAGEHGHAIMKMLELRLDHGIECTTPDLE